MEQIEALELMKQGHNIFLSGVAGTGKSYTLNQFIEWSKKETYKNVAVTSTTGISATHINNTTIHSWSGLGITSKKEWNPIKLANIIMNPYVEERILDTHILILEEISMLHGWQLDALNEICKVVKADRNRPFGGIQVIMSGDFLQLPPIGTDFTYAYESDTWQELKLKICYLNKIYRQGDENFIKILNEVREGNFNQASYDILSSRLRVRPVNSVKPVELYSKNVDVDIINDKFLNDLTTPLTTYKMWCTGREEVIKTMKKNCITPETLHLKVGAQVMFTQNDFELGYVNGTMGNVIEIKESSGLPVIQTYDGKLIEVDRKTWETSQYNQAKGKYEVVGRLTQLPLKLAWAITVHKSQGCSFDCAKMNLSGLFSTSMGYVALSRVRSLEGLTLMNLDKTIYLSDPKVLAKDAEFRKMSEELRGKI